eukprot:TRINITY_DN8058_c0_g1_i2.p1 TRINITY_DN8058_c0_g1~~TRINITY_DN8058_c0_g1_i2.p1  ORF type:complete len:511 (+),score=88.21 TRINITY_DN8058_c0_g1_i2:648-2180(+)
MSNPSSPPQLSPRRTTPAITSQDDVDLIIQLRNPIRSSERQTLHADLYPNLRAEDIRPSRRMLRSRSFGSLNVRLEELMKEDERSAIGRLLGIKDQPRHGDMKNLPILPPKEKERLDYHALFSGLSTTQRSYLSTTMAEKIKQQKTEVSIRSIILDEDNLLEPWLEFLESNYAIENYHFFVDVLRFRKTVKELANNIYEKYITKSAAEEVNLMWSTREGIEKSILEPNINMWNNAQDEVLMAFESDLLPKFLQSKMYQSWKEKHEESRLVTKKKPELIEAVRQGAPLDMLQRLLHSNSIYDTDMERQTALHVAAGRPDSFEVVVYLVAKNADITAYDVNCWTPLHVAANGGHLLTCQFLISKGASVKAETNEGNLSIHYLVKNTYKPEEIPLFLSVLHAMLENVDINHETKKGESVLHYACLSGNPDAAIQTLIEFGAKLHIENKRGNTPLHMAILKKHTSVVKLMLAHGADPNLATKAGSAYELAKNMKITPIVEVIEAHLAMTSSSSS